MIYTRRSIHEAQFMVTTTATRPGQSPGAWVGYGAAIWSVIFATLHAMWAAGWYVGLEEEKAREAFQRAWFLVYDLIVAGMCVVAAAVALALVQPWGRRLPHRLLALLAWTGTGLLVLRVGAAAVQTAFLMAAGRFEMHSQLLWEIWFGLGAVLFVLTLCRFRHVSK